MKGNSFLPVTLAEVKERGWAEVDFVYVCGDAYVDHPSLMLLFLPNLTIKAPVISSALAGPVWVFLSAQAT